MQHAKRTRSGGGHLLPSNGPWNTVKGGDHESLSPRRGLVNSAETDQAAAHAWGLPVQDLTYRVVNNNNRREKLMLLQKISGFFRAGELSALVSVLPERGSRAWLGLPSSWSPVQLCFWFIATCVEGECCLNRLCLCRWDPAEAVRQPCWVSFPHHLPCCLDIHVALQPPSSPRCALCTTAPLQLPTEIPCK